jgi:hypothetical protein
MYTFISQSLAEKLLDVSWFDHCGKPPVESESQTYKIPCTYINDENMRVEYNSVHWQIALVRASNLVGKKLSINHNDRHKQWNNIAVESGKFFDESLQSIFETYRDLFTLSDDFMRWNRRAIVGIFLSEYYRDLGQDTNFYDNFLIAYDKGRYPCGWNFSPEASNDDSDLLLGELLLY